MRRVAIVILTLFAATSTTAQEAESPHPIFPTTPSVDQLDNGLTVVTVPLSTPGVASYYTLVTVGSRDEVEPGRSGFAHLFEHMMFRGTERLPGEEYQRALQSFGADSNAYTTDDYTVYTITAPTSALPRVVEIEAERFQRLFYDEAGFRTETGAVLGEFNTDASDPRWAMGERMRELAFSHHTYGHTTMGFLRDVCAMPELFEYSRQFYQRYYTPDNTTIIAVGDVDRAALLELVQTHYGDWQGRRYANDIPVEPPPTGSVVVHIPWSGSTAPRMMIGYRVPPFVGTAATAEERSQAIRRTAALEVVRALAFDESSPLHQRLVVDEQVLMRLSSWSNDFAIDPHLFTISAMFRPTEGFVAPTDFEPTLEAIQNDLANIAAGAVDVERITAVQSHIRYALLGRLEAPGHVAGTLAHFIAVGGDVSALVEFIDALDAVTSEDVATAAASYLIPDHRVVVTLATAAEGEDVPPLPTCADFEDEPSVGE